MKPKYIKRWPYEQHWLSNSSFEQFPFFLPWARLGAFGCMAIRWNKWRLGKIKPEASKSQTRNIYWQWYEKIKHSLLIMTCVQKWPSTGRGRALYQSPYIMPHDWAEFVIWLQFIDFHITVEWKLRLSVRINIYIIILLSRFVSGLSHWNIKCRPIGKLNFEKQTLWDR